MGAVDFNAVDQATCPTTKAVPTSADEKDLLNPRSLRETISNNKISSSELCSMNPKPFELLGNKRIGLNDREEVLTTMSDTSIVEDAYPCTPLQEGLMALAMMQHGKYTPRMMYKLPSNVDLPKFQLAWQATVDSNTILRTVIIQTSRCDLIQAILPPSMIDWLTATDLDRYLWLDRQKVPNFGSHLFRYAIVSDGSSSSNYFVWTVHHAAIDGWSLRLLLDQVDKRYQGSPYSLLGPFRQFISHISEQNDRNVRNYWSRELAGIAASHFPSPPLDGSASRAEISTVHQIKLPTFRKELATRSTLIQAAWALVMRRRTCSKDAIYGLVLAGRNSSVDGIETICGPTITTVPFRLCLRPGESYRDWMKSISSKKAEMKQYQHAGIQNIQRLSPDCAFACKFQNLLVVQPITDKPRDSLFVDRVNEMGHWTGLTTYSLLLQCQLTADGFTAHAIFDTDAITMDEMRLVLHEFESTAQYILANADQPVDSMQVHGLELDSNGQMYLSGSPKIESCVHDLIEKCVDNRPTSVAVDSWDGQLSKEELSLYSSKVAHKIAASRIPKYSRIPLLFEKSVWTVVAMMATMKVGGTFVALNPTDPKERLHDLISQLGSALVLCSDRCSQRLQGIACEEIVVGQYLRSEVQPACLPLEPISPATIMYVVFTSGSTGKPKGVEIEHSACASTLTQLIKAYAIDCNTRTLQFSSYNFDGCILEIFGTLMAGGCVCIPSEKTRLDGLASFVTNEQVNLAFFVPSFARTVNPADVATLRTLLLGGEMVTQQDIDQWFGKIRLFVTYGPTECCIMCTALEITQKPYVAGRLGPLVIGDAVVIDEVGRLAPGNTRGELYVGGPALAKGYLNEPALTAAAFRCNDSWSSDLEGRSRRWYKTGDLVRMGQDGIIEYIGRNDKQVKIRGQRVELGEVEFHIRECLADVSDIVVDLIIPRHDPKSPLLLAFVSVNRDQRRGVAPRAKTVLERPLPPGVSTEVWGYLEKSLPGFMVPSLIFPINQMPLSITGKKDMRILRTLTEQLNRNEIMMYSCAKREIMPPRNKHEETLRRVWADILNIGLDSIGRDDSFIRLGGDSIQAMKLAAVCRHEGLDLTVANVFRHPRLRDLALMMVESQNRGEKLDSELPPFALMEGIWEPQHFLPEIMSLWNINADQLEDIYPCTPLQEGMMALSLRRPGAYVARHEIELSSDLAKNLELFHLSWEKVVEANLILRTRIIHTEQHGFLQVVVKERAHWCIKNPNHEFAEDNRPFMTVGSPLSQFTVELPTDDNNDTLNFVWTMHHSIYDARSMELVLEQVDDVYRALMSESPTAEQGIKTRKFNSCVEKILQRSQVDSDCFWRAQICHGNPDMFPVVPPGIVPWPTAELEFHFDVPTQKEADVTMSTFVRAAWALTISSYTNSEDIIFGVTLSGRTNPAGSFDSIVGPTISTVPVRVRCRPTAAAEDFLLAVHNQSLEMAPFEQIGLANLRRMSSEAKAACNFQNLLIVQYQTGSDRSDSLFNGLKRSSTHVGIFDTYALTMECTVNDHSLKVKAIFDPQIIDPSQMRRIISQFQNILCHLSPTQGGGPLVRDILRVNSEDLETIWTRNANLPKTLETCIHTLIQEQMRYTPQAQAICAWDGEFSYHDLDTHSSRLAQHLKGLGVLPEVAVPVLFYKSKWYVVAILGILRAGGAFTPLEPSHPVARLRSITRSLKSSLLICSSELESMASFVDPKSRILSLGDFEMDQLHSKPDSICSLVSPQNTAYIVFTSGTTGTPKGVVIEHRAYCSSARDHAKALNFDQKSRHLQFASHSFDTSIEDILTTLITGGCICIPSESQRDQDIIAAMEIMNVNKADLTPSFLSDMDPSEVPRLDTLIVGGESLTSKVIRRWAERVRLINGYGTSECAVTNLVNGNLSCNADASNIGRAVGAVTWILNVDDHDRLAPVGTIGELAIEGPVLARGYLNDVALTQRSFIDNPAWAQEVNGFLRPSRIYKTGDLAAYNPDGTISYRGRKDTQAKFHGQRMELQEIESHLVDHPNIEKAMVLLPKTGPCENSLTAVIQCRGDVGGTVTTVDCLELVRGAEWRLNDIGLDWSQLCAYLNTKVPGYMVPRKWAALAALPLHVTKKLDRARVISWLESLSGEAANIFGDATKKSVPLSADETTALHISEKIGDLVGDPSIKGRDAILFSIGVDSIRMSSLIAFIRKSYGVSIPMQKLINIHISVRDVAKHVLDVKTKFSGQDVPRLNILEEVADLGHLMEAKIDRKARLGSVFLTGATGFLGTQILRVLLETEDVTKAIVHVRARDIAHGRERITASARQARWWSDDLSSKLEVWIGDLARPQLGLNLQQWTALGLVDAIIHNGAAVQWFADYQMLKAANVTSTVDLLSVVAATDHLRCPPHFVYVSGGRDFGDEIGDIEAARLLSSVEGYSQTKFVSELLVKQIMQRSRSERRHVHITKPGLIIGTAHEGVANQEDFLWRYVAAVIDLGCFPAPHNGHDWLMVSSADKVVAALIRSLLEEPEFGPKCGHVTHIRDGIPLLEFWDILREDLGYELRPVAHDKWMELLRKKVELRTESHPLWPVMHLVQEGNLASPRPKKLILETMSETKAAIRKNIEYLIEVGFLKAPEPEFVHPNPKHCTVKTIATPS